VAQVDNCLSTYLGIISIPYSRVHQAKEKINGMAIQGGADVLLQNFGNQLPTYATTQQKWHDVNCATTEA
jgi:hypothetical protein